MNAHAILAGGNWAAGTSAGNLALRLSAHQQPPPVRDPIEPSAVEQRFLDWVLAGHGKAARTVTKCLALYATTPTAKEITA